MLLGTHSVIVEPVDDCFDSDVKAAGELLDSKLVRVRVTLVSSPQGFLLLLAEEQARLFLASWLITR